MPGSAGAVDVAGKAVEWESSLLPAGHQRLPWKGTKVFGYFPSSYKYSTNDITAPSNPSTFLFVDSIT